MPLFSFGPPLDWMDVSGDLFVINGVDRRVKRINPLSKSAEIIMRRARPSGITLAI